MRHLRKSRSALRRTAAMISTGGNTGAKMCSHAPTAAAARRPKCQSYYSRSSLFARSDTTSVGSRPNANVGQLRDYIS